MKLEFKEDQRYIEEEWTIKKKAAAITFIIFLVVGFCIMISEAL